MHLLLIKVVTTNNIEKGRGDMSWGYKKRWGRQRGRNGGRGRRKNGPSFLSGGRENLWSYGKNGKTLGTNIIILLGLCSVRGTAHTLTHTQIHTHSYVT